MRQAAASARIRRLAEALGAAATEPTRIYLTGGASAVLEGWRQTTVDVDLLIEPETDAVMRRLAELEEELETNIKTASPLGFLPSVPGWRERSRPRFRTGAVEASIRLRCAGASTASSRRAGRSRSPVELAAGSACSRPASAC